METIDYNLIKNLYRNFYKARKFEEVVAEIYPTDKIKSPVHLSIGQETPSVAICENLLKTDYVFATYRGHAAYISKGGNINELMAELYGKQTGCSKGKGGSMHIIDASVNFMGTSAVVGTTIPVAVGYAHSLKYLGDNSIVVIFFGDGATDEGVFWESINYAVLHELRVLFVCENNRYADPSRIDKRNSAIDLISNKVKSFIPLSYTITDDIIEVEKKARSVIKVMRSDSMSAFMELDVYRWKEHVGINEDPDYRGIYNSLKEAKKNDQLIRLAKLINKDDIIKIEINIDKEIYDSVEFAENSEFPNNLEIHKDVL